MFVRLLISSLFFVLITSTAHAVPPSTSSGTLADLPSGERGYALEVNALWPFFPGGISDFKLVLPVAAGGHAIVGLHSDFAWRSSREPDAGKVANLALKLGYRQYFLGGFHLDATVNAGWRQERDNPYDGTTLNAFAGRLWTFAGYQHELSERWYLNTRAGVGMHLWRTDRFASEERELVPAGDLNVGVRF